MKLSPLANQSTSGTASPDSELPRVHLIKGNELPKPSKLRRFLAALFRTAPVIVPGAGAGVAMGQVQAVQQAASQQMHSHVVSQEHVVPGEILHATRIQQMVDLLVIVVPEESIESKRAETKSILEETWLWAVGLPAAIASGMAADYVKKSVLGALLLKLYEHLDHRAKETGNKGIAWLAAVALKLAELAGKQPASTIITADQLAAQFGDQTNSDQRLAAASMLLQLVGCKKQGSEWQIGK